MNPHSDTVMTENECVTDGGEVAFCKRMVDESVECPHKTVLFTTLLGKKRSIKPLLSYVKEKGFFHMGTTVLYQGRTIRWCLFWTRNEVLGEHMKQHPEHYKVFAVKKIQEQGRTNTIDFAKLDWKEMNERIEEFCKRCWVIKLYDNK